MQLSTILLLVCLAVAVAYAHPVYEQRNLVDSNVAVHQAEEVPVHERSPRTKRGLLFLKKKLLLGALGLKAAKIGAVGVAGALALKKTKSFSGGSSHRGSLGYGYSSSYPDWHVSVRSWK